MTNDPEMKTLNAVVTALEELDDQEACARIIEYVSKRMKLAAVAKPGPVGTASADPLAALHTKKPELYEHFADLFDAARPKTDTEKALVAAYWVQFCQGASDFGSQTLNDELKHLGYPIGNITRALDALVTTRPNLIQQMRKDGTTKQARKTFRVTNEGKKRVEAMIGKERDDDAGLTA